MKTITSLPPEIQQHFNRFLLGTPIILCEDSQTLWDICTYIMVKLSKKVNGNKTRKKRFYRMMEEFNEVYERIEAEEERIKTQTGKDVKRPFYFFGDIDKKGERIFDGIKEKTRKRLLQIWRERNNSI